MRPNISSPRKSDESSRDSSTASPNPAGYSPQFSPQTDFLSPSSVKQKHKIEQFSSGPSDSTSKSDAKKIRLSNVNHVNPLSDFFVDNEPFRESDGLPRSWLDDIKPVFDTNSSSAVYVDAKCISNSISSPSITSDESPTMTNISNPFPQIFTDDMAEFEDMKKGGKKPVADCNVCGDRAIAHMHYGGICCYSCKAFFRRASQTGNDKNYKCKKDQDCVVSVANRRACQYCRFMKCIEIGMKPTWVLSDKQCQIRFRKGKGDVKVKVEGEGVVVKIEDGIEEEIKPLIIKIAKPLAFTFTIEEDKTVKRFCEKYIESKEMISFSTENNVIFNNLFSDQSSTRDQEGPSAFDLSGLINTVIKKNLHYLSSNHLLSDLDQRDINSLILKNLNETCHLRGAIRFNTKSKNFMWYFNKQDTMQLAYQKPGCSTDPTKLKNAVIGQTDLAKFYDDQVSGDIFKVIHRLCELGLREEVYLILVFVSLFSSDGIKLVNRKLVETSQVETLLLLHRYLIHIYGSDIARMKLSQIMGVMVDLREVVDRSMQAKKKF